MSSGEKTYLAIDLKSFYASVECVERGLDPLNAYLVVADPSRTEKTICLAVSPALKSYGISGRARLFEVVAAVRDINAQRLAKAPGGVFKGESTDHRQVQADPSLKLEYLAAVPQMNHYMEVSAAIYQIYLKYIAPEDIHVYSIDEVFIDATPYLSLYGLTARELAMKMILEVLHTTGITATAGIGSNLYLAKIAMDIDAKHLAADENGVRISELNEYTYRQRLWDHKPLTDFWRIGSGTARRLASVGLYTMRDVALCSIGPEGDYYNEDLLYGLFGINAELLIDHAWGHEPVTMAQIKAYKPENQSLSMGQVLHEPYSFEKGRLIVREMADLMANDLIAKKLVTDQVVLAVGYDIENLSHPERMRAYRGKIHTDHYGRKVPESVHGSQNLGEFTASGRALLQAFTALYDRLCDRDLTIRRLNLVANHIEEEGRRMREPESVQLDLFSMDETIRKKRAAELEVYEKEKRARQAMLEIKQKYGKNAVLKGMNLEEGGTSRERNEQVGGHRA